MRLPIIAALALAGIAAPALAEGTTAPADGTGAGMLMASTATIKLKYATVKPADIMASKLVGTSVYNNQKEKVGEIDDLVISNGKTITGLVIGVGGFLGLGESYVVVDPSSVAIHNQDGKWSVYVDTDKDTLKNAPKFEYSKKKN